MMDSLSVAKLLSVAVVLGHCRSETELNCNVSKLILNDHQPILAYELFCLTAAGNFRGTVTCDASVVCKDYGGWYFVSFEMESSMKLLLLAGHRPSPGRGECQTPWNHCFGK